MRFSKMFIPTTKETPKDASLPSHQYLLRGGFMTQVGAGIYNFLPLGKIVLDKIRAVVKEELDNAGNIEVSLGFVTPSELWQNSGRLEKYGKELLRFKDRKDGNFVLGPTHEEMMVELVKNRVTSYKQLPLNLYQINLKFRDEARPRFGLMRGREFLMKDGYSFHADELDMKREFDLMEVTYKRIFTRLGLEFKVVEADSGAIGGSGSKEFMVLANSGEDTIVACKACKYGANVEAAKRKARKSSNANTQSAFEKVNTPDVKTIEEVSGFLKVEPFYTIKAVAKRALYDEGSKIVVFFIRGDDELQETKAANAVSANDLVDVSEAELADAGLVAGFMGPLDCKVDCVVDSELQYEKAMACGANEKDYHFVGLNMTLHEFKYDDLTVVQEGDVCPYCGGELYHTKGIEVGHIFQLGTRYSKPLGANFLDINGKSQPFVMGTYGIGVSRLLAAIIEQHHDDKGCKWTKESAPFAVDIIVSNIKDEAQLSFATELYNTLKAKNIEVLFDDRDERFGPKISDFELLGIPYAVVVGKGLAEGNVEIIERATLNKTQILKESIVQILMEKLV